MLPAGPFYFILIPKVIIFLTQIDYFRNHFSTNTTRTRGTPQEEIMSRCTEGAKEDIKRWMAEDAAKEMAEHGMTLDATQEALKLIEKAGLDDKDGVHIRVITLKSTKKKTSDDSQEAEKPQDEPKPEATEEPEPEKVTERAVALLQANVRFAKAMKDAASEFYQLSCLAGEILKENQELRARLGEK